MVSVNTGNNISRQTALTQFKPLKNPFITSVSVSVNYLNGDLIIFENDAVSTFELQIRPRE